MNDNEFDGHVTNEYDVLVRESITTLYQDRLKALAQNRVLGKKYNEILAANKKLNQALLETQEQLSHALKERDRLKRNAKKSS
jgi:hypothetical protein